MTGPLVGMLLTGLIIGFGAGTSLVALLWSRDVFMGDGGLPDDLEACRRALAARERDWHQGIADGRYSGTLREMAQQVRRLQRHIARLERRQAPPTGEHSL